MTLDEIAKEISSYLKVFEARHNTKETTLSGMKVCRYFQARAYRTGRYVGVVYVNYHGPSNLTRKEAEDYLAWLRAGHVGKHYSMKVGEKR